VIASAASAPEAKARPPLGWAALAALLSFLLVASGFSFLPGAATVVWLAAALFLEGSAVALPGFGFFSAAPAVYLAGAGSPAFASWGVLAGLVLGASFRGGFAPSGRAAELSHALPTMAGALVLSCWPHLVGQPPGLLAFAFALAAYVGMDRLCTGPTALARLAGPERVAWLRLRRTLTEQQLALLAAAGAMFVLTSQAIWLPLLMAPLLWTTHQAASNALFRVQATMALETERKALRLKADLHETRSEKRKLEGEVSELEGEVRELEGEVSQLETLLSASRQFGSTLDRRELAQLALGLARQELGADGGGVLWGDLALTFGGPKPKHLASLVGPNPPAQPPGYQTWMITPLPREGRDFGHLILLWVRPVPLSEERRQVITAVAYGLGMSLENADRYEQVTRAQEQLVESSKLRAVGQLAAGVAHELNSPLGAIRLALDSLSGQQLNEAGIRRLGRAQGACQRAQGIVDKLLIYSREKKAPPQAFSLMECVDDVVVFLSASLQQRETRLVTEVTGEGKVMGSAPEIQQVLINLVLNACDAYEGRLPEERRVVLGCREEGRHGVLWVEDRAGGIIEEHRDRIFEPFFTTKPVGQGTGLGLSISREIVTAHQGELLYQAVPGGSRFLVRFPLVS
jgi:signal transduction histidine kinase